MDRTAGLETYRQKRDFKRTSEPQGKLARSSGKLRFVIQKHAARRTHFDFRLELDGVLKSWAVTRGPSLNPADKRLAVHVEDHPVAYGRFEGTIPKGEYGGGTVMLWDEGGWSPQGDPHEGLKKGVLKFELKGERLKGGFALVRLRKKGTEKRDNWLLVKERDGYADPDTDPVATWTTSVKSGRDMDAIAAGEPDSPARANSETKTKTKTKAARKANAGGKLPKFVSPQLATLVKSPPDGDDWLHEIKYDGYRAIAAVGAGRVHVFTRSGLDWTDKFAQIADALSRLDVDSALLDGEVVALDDKGRTSFEQLQHGLKDGKVPLTYYVFDLIELDGKDLRSEPLERRKAALQKLLKGAPKAIRYSDHVVGHGDKVLAKACAMGLEGIVSKRADKPYLSRRTKSWLKSKCSGNDEFVIGGYRTSDKKGRPFASLLLGEFVGDDLHYRGRVGTGFDDRDFAELGKRFAQLARKTSPFADAPAEAARDARWVSPQLVAQIAYTERTREGRLRHPSFLGLRSDKPAAEVQLHGDSTDTSDGMADKKSSSADDFAGVKLTSPDRVLYPETGLTKAELARYLLTVSKPMLKHVRGRPVSLVRCPEGVGKECFFQKHGTKGLPEALKTVPVEESDGKVADYLVIDNPAGLVSAAQIGALEIHVWGAHWKTLERPDRLVFDLDPDTSLDFGDVRDAARDVRKLLQAAELESFPLVTGGKGIHVVVPLDARQSWDEVKSFAKNVAARLSENEPDRFTATMSKARRKGRIFIDWLRNERGATAIAPYSPRARASGSVAAPLTWDELGRVKNADAYTIANMPRRLASLKRDPWQGYFTLRQRIGAKAARFFATERQR
jgi:bifunctional non-homologous end joining protein LigD